MGGVDTLDLRIFLKRTGYFELTSSKVTFVPLSLCVGVKGIFDFTTIVGYHCGWMWMKCVSNG
jgi:hypothetical protein